MRSWFSTSATILFAATVALLWGAPVAVASPPDPDAGWSDAFNLPAPDALISALISTPEGLVAGGEFTRIGGIAASYAARWNGSEWEAMGTEPSRPGAGTPRSQRCASGPIRSRPWT